MKKIFQIITLLVAAVSCACSDFDDSGLRKRIDDYKNRIEALKAKSETLAAQLADLSYLTGGNVITSVSQDAEGKYVVTYKDNADKEHTLVLATMSDILDVPIVGVQLGEDGIYYWTQCVDGRISWLTDAEGNKFPVSGYTPTISVDQEGYWTIDGERLTDASGKPVEANDSASSVFRAAGLDADGNFSLTLGDGTTLTLPVFNTLNLKLDAAPVTMVADVARPLSVAYALSGEAAEQAIVALAKVEGVEAKLDTEKQTIDISFGETFSQGSVIVMAYDLAENVVVRPLFFRTSALGTVVITTADELTAFAAAVNAGGEQAAGKAVRGADIDLKGAAWTPIGNGSYTTANKISGATFQGTFDGKGYKITNLKIAVPADAAAGSAWGLFGVLEGAEVRNVVIGEGSSLTSTAAAMTAMGAVAGYAYDATVENCENHAAIDFAGGSDNVRESIGGVVGATCTAEVDCVVTGCKNYGRISSTNTVNTKNGGTGFSVGGIVGFTDALGTPATRCRVENCVNEGAIEAQATRTAGIVASMNKYSEAKGCTNNAAVVCTDTKASNSRVAGIVSGMGAQTSLVNCVNNGGVTFAVAGDTTHGYAAGIAGQTNDNSCVIDGCENYGTVLSDIIDAATNKYIAIVCANTNKKTVAIRNCKVGGKIGPYSGGAEGATELTEANYAQYIYFSLAGAEPVLENNVFASGGITPPPAKGIATAEELMAFRDAVNRGESTAEWEDEQGVVNLLKDIDLSGAGVWTPIGNASAKWSNSEFTVTGNAFKGTFDGGGHALRNVKLAYAGGDANAAYGLFGVLEDATVRNLTIGAAEGDASSLTVTATGGPAEIGVVAGSCCDATISEVVNYAKIVYDGTCGDKRISTAMVGLAYASAKGTTLEHLTNYGAIVCDTHGNSSNGLGNAIHIGGICGVASGNTNNKVSNTIAYCDNYGGMTSNSARTSGIVAAANNYTALNSCINHGDQYNTCGNSGRLGNITCITGTSCPMTDCVNNGDLVSTMGARCGGLVSLANHATNSFSGCANYGEIITDSEQRGVFFGYSGYVTSWVNCIAGGKVGVYNNGQYIYDSHSEADQVRYLGVQKSGSPINVSNITYLIGSSSGGPGVDDPVEPTLRILFIGNSFTKDAVEHLPKIVDAAGIKTLKMTHLYYGGRTIPEYADGYATRSDYTCYKYLPSTSVWLSYSGYTIQQIVKEEPWDIVCIQEHTGNKAAWAWDATEKGAVESLLASIKADNAKTPRFAYIMSQAYFNMDKIGGNSKPYMTFTTQSEMFDVIVAQAKKVLAETEVEQIIPTGTVLQNLRTSSLNNAMDLTRDGYHMDYGLSRYAAACAVFEMLVAPAFDGVTLDGNAFRYDVSNTADGSYTTPVTDATAPVALQAARYAIQNPFTVTDMSVSPSTPDNGIEDTDFENDTDKE